MTDGIVVSKIEHWSFKTSVQSNCVACLNLQTVMAIRGNHPVKILCLAADPRNAPRRRLGQELQAIQDRLQASEHHARFSVQQRLSVRPETISQAILEVKPQVVHFVGHGTAEGLWFENESGRVQIVTPDALAAVFELAMGEVQCVVLNACYSSGHAAKIAQHIPLVIGMRGEIGDRAAIAFSVGFYRSLGANESIERAYLFGCAEIQLQGYDESLTPVLYQAGRPIAGKQLKDPGQQTRLLDIKETFAEVPPEQVTTKAEEAAAIAMGGCRDRAALNQYLETVLPKLKQQGALDIRQTVSIGNTTTHYIAKIADFELPFGLFSLRGDAFFILADFDVISMKALRQFSAQCLQWAKQHTTPSAVGQAIFNARVPSHVCFAVAIVDRLDETTAAEVCTMNPFDFKVDLMWYEVPAIYELSRHTLHFYEKAPNFFENFKGEVVWQRLRKILQQTLTEATEAGDGL